MARPIRTSRERADLTRALAETLNQHCAENDSNTPDFMLAEYLMQALETFEDITVDRERWYGVELYPTQDTVDGIRDTRPKLTTK